MHQDHPGGANVILRYGGKDATAAYVPIHPSDALDKNLAPEKHLGTLDSESINRLKESEKNKVQTKDELRVEEALKAKPPLQRIVNVEDMEVRYLDILSCCTLITAICRKLRRRSCHIGPWLTILQPETTLSVSMRFSPVGLYFHGYQPYSTRREWSCLWPLLLSPSGYETCITM
jgi:hypothetical protein